MSRRTIGVGMLGYAFMDRAHTNALHTIAYMAWPPPADIELVALGGRNASAVEEAAERFGFTRAVTDWRGIVKDPNIQLFDNLGPNSLHAEPTIAAARAGKHVVCEKPLGRTAEEAHEIWRAVEPTGVKHLCAFNYRFVPAVRLARQIVAAGELGEIHHFRGSYLQDWLVDPAAPATWRLDGEQAGSGALGDLGAHVIDQARYLVGEIAATSGRLRTFVATPRGGGRLPERRRRHHRASRFATGRKNALTWEINGSRGSLAFDLERLNELQICTGTKGFTRRLVTEANDPYWSFWWPDGHVIGWEHSSVHELHHMLTAIVDDSPIAPHGATFEDGYRTAAVCDAIARSDASGSRETITYRGIDG